MIVIPSRTVKSVILNSYHRKRLLGEGGYDAVLNFRTFNFNNYLLKIPLTSLNNFPNFVQCLTEHSSLTPVTCGISHNFGQPIMQMGEVSILPRVKGDSIEKLFHTLGRESAMELLSKIPQTSYDGLMFQFRYLMDRGIGDFNLGNVLVDIETTSFNVIDIAHAYPASLNIELILTEILPNARQMKRLNLKNPSLFCEHMAVVERRIIEAARKYNIPEKGDPDRLDEVSRVSFGVIHDLKGVSLLAPPSHLLRALQAAEKVIFER